MKRLLKNDIFKSISVLVSGTVLAQIIPIVSQIFLRRMYSAEEFGAYSVFTSLVGILVLIFSLRYELSIVNPKTNIKAFNILSGVFFISLFFMFIFYVILFFFIQEICLLVNFPIVYKHWLYAMPFVLFLVSFYKTIEYWLVRSKNFKSISINKFSRRISESSIQLGLGTMGISWGLVIGDFFGNIINVIVGIKQSIKTYTFKHISIKGIQNVLYEYREYPMYNLLPSLLNTAALLFPILFINKLFGIENTAQFDLTRTVLAVPAALLSVSLSQVYLERFAFKANKGLSIIKDFYTLILMLAGISVVTVVVVYFFGVELFSFVFGNEWVEAGEIAELLIFKYALVFIVSPLSVLLSVLKKIKFASIWQFGYFTLILSLYYIKHNDLFDFLNTFLMMDLISYFIYFIMIYYMVMKYEQKTIK